MLQGELSAVRLTEGINALALPLGELSPKVTERGLQLFLNDKIKLFALSVLAVLGHLSQRERQGVLAWYSKLCLLIV